MKKIASLAIIGLITVSCSYKSSDSKKEIVKIQQDQLYGAWGEDDNENALFGIEEDSVFYVDAGIKYKYSINYDTLIIYEGEFLDKNLILRVDSDSMILKGIDSKVIFRLKRGSVQKSVSVSFVTSIPESRDSGIEVTKIKIYRCFS
jgi:hypothetical protein